MTTYFVDLPPSTFALSAAAPGPGGTGILAAGAKFGIQAYAEEGVYGKSTSVAGGAGIVGVHDGAGGIHYDEAGNPISDVGHGVHGLKLGGGPGGAIFGEASGVGTGVIAVSQFGSAISATNHGNVTTVSVINNNLADPSEALWARKMGGRGYAVRAEHHGADGVGLFAYGQRLAGDFAGNVNVFGNLQVSGTIIHAKGADCSEDFDVAPDVGPVEPGTVMVLDEGGKLRRATTPCDTRVVGVVSGAGSYRPAIVLDRREEAGDRLPIALLGKAFCWADASYGAIAAGDCVTTSATPGHAMLAKAPPKAGGAIIGKALAPLENGRALIPVLICLH